VKHGARLWCWYPPMFLIFQFVQDCCIIKLKQSEECRSVSLEQSLELGTGSSLDGSNFGIGNLSVEHLDVAGSLDFTIGETGGANDLNSLRSGRVTSAHLKVKLGDSSAESGVSVFLVHVDGVSTGVVSKENSEVLEVGCFLFVDFGGGNDLSLDSSDLVLSLHVVPVLGSGENFVGGEDS